MSLVFTVKELSKITNVSARNIRYYDTIGLFEPSGIHENGYRFYELEKIEELRLISYLRHTGIAIKEIKNHLENRDIDAYNHILSNHIQKLDDEIKHLTAVKTRLQNRVGMLDYIRKLPPIDEIIVEKLPKRPVIKLYRKIMTPLDWEAAMNDFIHGMPPSLMIGETGFFVDMKHDRRPTEFEGLYIMADDPFIKDSDQVSFLEEGFYLTVYIKGNHDDAAKKYSILKQYAVDHNLVLDNYALERTLIDHFISSNQELYITEISIPIVK